jgi:ribosomal protein S18 acetylase RimI-like enzyme
VGDPRGAADRWAIRPAGPHDAAVLYDICLRTGDAGADATGLYQDAALLGHVYAGPYLMMSEGLGFVLTDARPDPSDGESDPVARVTGYVVGAADSLAFEAQCERLWWPALREQYPVLPPWKDEDDRPPTDAALVAQIHHPQRWDSDLAKTYPAHLHIDLLPQAQGHGQGRRLIDAFVDEVRSRGATGVLLGVAAKNRHARGFYEHLGFRQLEEDSDGILLGLRLS